LRVVFEVLTLTGYRTHSDLIEYWEDEWQDLFDEYLGGYLQKLR
jgi:hypothetical protein